jgi:hypothetical protein
MRKVNFSKQTAGASPSFSQWLSSKPWMYSTWTPNQNPFHLGLSVWDTSASTRIKGPSMGFSLTLVSVNSCPDDSEAIELKALLSDPTGLYQFSPGKIHVHPGNGGSEADYGAICLGTPICSSLYIVGKLQEKLAEVQADATKLLLLLAHPQALLALMRKCLNNKVDLLLRTISPSITSVHLVPQFNVILKSTWNHLWRCNSRMYSGNRQCFLSTVGDLGWVFIQWYLLLRLLRLSTSRIQAYIALTLESLKRLLVPRLLLLRTLQLICLNSHLMARFLSLPITLRC